jgi:hypothetical protein
VLPQASVALYVRFTKYLFGQLVSSVASLTCVTVTVPLQLSLAVTNAVFGAGTFAAHVTVIAEGHVSVGATLSLTVIVCVHVAVLLHASVARYVRVTVNLLIQLTLLVASLTCVTVTVPLQLSDVVTEAVFGAGMFDAQITVCGAGQEINGAWVSLTVMICEQVAVLLQASVAR